MNRSEVDQFLAEVRGAKVNRKGDVKGIGQDYLVKVLVNFDKTLDNKMLYKKELEIARNDINALSLEIGKEKDYSTGSEETIAAYEAIGRAMSTPEHPVDSPLKLNTAVRELMRDKSKAESTPGRMTRDEKADYKSCRKIVHDLKAQLARRAEDSPGFKVMRDMLKERDEQIQNIAPDMQALKDRLEKYRMMERDFEDMVLSIHQRVDGAREIYFSNDDTRPLTKDEIVAGVEGE